MMCIQLANPEGAAAERRGLWCAEEHKAAAVEAAKALQASFFKRRSARIPRALLVDVARKHPGVAEAMLAELAGFATWVRATLHPEALQLLQSLLSLKVRRQPWFNSHNTALDFPAAVHVHAAYMCCDKHLMVSHVSGNGPGSLPMHVMGGREEGRPELHLRSGHNMGIIDGVWSPTLLSCGHKSGGSGSRLWS